MVDDSVDKSNSPLVVPVFQAPPPDDFDIFSNMSKQTKVSTSINNDQMVKKKAFIKHEVHSYLINTNNNTGYLRPLE